MGSTPRGTAISDACFHTHYVSVTRSQHKVAKSHGVSILETHAIVGLTHVIRRYVPYTVYTSEGTDEEALGHPALAELAS